MEFYKTFLFTFISLLPVCNPIGIASVFLTLTKPYENKARYRLAYRVGILSTALLFATLILGPAIFNFFGITLPFIKIGGGIVLFYTSWEMLTSTPRITEAEKLEAKNKDINDIAFFPLTLPLTAGAGAIAITSAIAIECSNNTNHLGAMQEYAGAAVGIVAVFALSTICYRFSDKIFNKIGKTGSTVVTRLSAFILLIIAMEVMWQGLSTLIVNLNKQL